MDAAATQRAVERGQDAQWYQGMMLGDDNILSLWIIPLHPSDLRQRNTSPIFSDAG